MKYFEGFYIRCNGAEYPTVSNAVNPAISNTEYPTVSSAENSAESGVGGASENCISGADTSVAFIFGKHAGKCERSSFIQIITRDNSYYMGFDYAAYSRQPRGFGVEIGANKVSEKGLSISINRDGLSVNGRVEFGAFSKVKYNVMGPLNVLPFMECKHCTVSMRHSLSGSIVINGREYNFDGGVGYIEGDRGKSFPQKYFWSQCNVFAAANPPSIFASCAIIPYLGVSFTGTVSVIQFDGREYRLATYLGARVRQFTSNKLVVSQGFGGKRKVLEVEALNASGDKSTRPLLAPDKGVMSRTVRESVNMHMRYKFTFGGNTLFDLTSPHSAYEFGTS